MKKIFATLVLLPLVFLFACSDAPPATTDNDQNQTYQPGKNDDISDDISRGQDPVIELLNVTEALEIFAEGVEAQVFDIETGIRFRIMRTTGGYNTLADVEPLTVADTENMLYIAGGTWNIRPRAVIVTVQGRHIAGSIMPFPHSGCDDNPHGVIVDNRNGATGRGINLNSIRDNGMTGVVDIYFFNSLIPGLNRINERHQEMVLEAYEFDGFTYDD
ncbi:MAG: hypothetical protein FWB93_03675 [Oscillospiraceae bacterium]|nr:hypothetical protein [Oscillospiraceae bacterium]